MAIPKYYEFYGIILKSIRDGKIHNFKDISQSIIKQQGFSEEEQSLMLSNGKQTVLENRIIWSKTYLKKAGLIESPARGMIILSREGKKVLDEIDHIDNDYLLRYESFRSFKRIKSSP